MQHLGMLILARFQNTIKMHRVFEFYCIVKSLAQLGIVPFLSWKPYYFVFCPHISATAVGDFHSTLLVPNWVHEYIDLRSR